MELECSSQGADPEGTFENPRSLDQTQHTSQSNPFSLSLHSTSLLHVLTRPKFQGPSIPTIAAIPQHPHQSRHTPQSHTHVTKGNIKIHPCQNPKKLSNHPTAIVTKQRTPAPRANFRHTLLSHSQGPQTAPKPQQQQSAALHKTLTPIHYTKNHPSPSPSPSPSHIPNRNHNPKDATPRIQCARPGNEKEGGGSRAPPPRELRPPPRGTLQGLLLPLRRLALRMF